MRPVTWLGLMLAALAHVVMMPAVAAAGPLEDARTAEQRGDYATELRVLRPLADQGDADAQAALGWMYSNGRGVTQDYAQAVAWYRKAADQGYAVGQAGLGEMYEKGWGLPQDDAQALMWLHEATDQGNASAQAHLGEMYANGQGVPQDYAQAVAWYRKATDQGNAPAQAALGWMYEKGLGLPQDDLQAAAWYRKAADQGNADAQAHLGEMYANGQGVPQDYAQAVAWYRKAADQGDASAQYNLGLMYENGQGVAQDAVRAHMWFNLAASATSDASVRDQSVNARDFVAVKMTPAQRAKAQRMAREWKPNYSVSATLEPPVGARGETVVPMVSDGGTFVVPVTINGQLTLNFVVDSGAADVSVPADVVMTLLRTNTITDADFLGKQTYRLADGSDAPSQQFVIRTLKVGDKTLENVVGSIAPVEGGLLLGQSFLRRFKSWSIDNERGVLLLN